MENKPLSVEHGTGTPNVIIKDESNNPILDSEGIDISEYVTNFSYKYDEEDDDECTITLESSTPSIIDIAILDEDSYILVQWSVVLPSGQRSISPVRKVMVRDHNWSLSPSGHSLTLQCTDGWSKYKGTPVTFSNSDGNPNITGNSLLDSVVEAISGRFTDKYTIPIGYPYRDTKYMGVASTYGTPIYQDFGPTKQKLAVIMGVPPGSTLHTAVDSITKSSTDGPIHVSGRDDKIIVSKVNFYKKPLGKFIWAGGQGDLLNFTLSTSREKTQVTSAEATGLDEDKNLTKISKQLIPNDGDSKPLGSYPFVNQTMELFNSLDSESEVSTWVGKTARKVKANQTASNRVETGINIEDQDEWRRHYIENPNPTSVENQEYINKVRQWDEENKKLISEGNITGLGNPLPEFTLKRKQKVTITVPVYLYSHGQLSLIERNLESNRNYNPNIWADREERSKKRPTVANAYRPKSDSEFLEGGMYAGGDIFSDARTNGWTVDNISEETYSVKGMAPKPKYMTISKYVNREVNIDVRTPFTSPGSAAIFENILGNGIQDSWEKKRQVDITVLGDPTLECSEVINVESVGKKYSGKYWIKSAIHIINSTGYKVNMECVGESVKPAFNTVAYKSNISKIQQLFVDKEGYDNTRLSDLRHKAVTLLRMDADELRRTHGIEGRIYQIEDVSEDIDGNLSVKYKYFDSSTPIDVDDATLNQVENTEKIIRWTKDEQIKKLNNR